MNHTTRRMNIRPRLRRLPPMTNAAHDSSQECPRTFQAIPLRRPVTTQVPRNMGHDFCVIMSFMNSPI